MHIALADYILQFKKPGDNPRPIRAGVSDKYQNPNGWITQEEWIEWAAPVWYGDFRGLPGGIRETDVLNVAQARDTNDERHLCPLQLGVIERCVKLWSAPDDTVFSPFAGIGSEGYEAVRLHRKFIGIELKRSYYESAIRNLRQAEERATREQDSLLSFIEQQEAAQELPEPEQEPETLAPEPVEVEKPAKPKEKRKTKAAPQTFVENPSLLSEMMDL